MVDRIDIGIDGGGSGCRVLIFAQGREGRAEGGPANVATDPAAAEAAIRAALLDALGQLSFTLDDLEHARIVAGLAGCRLPGVADSFAMRLPYLAYVVDDSVTALEGAFGGGYGTLMNLGTGSFVIRKDARGVTHQGGWGFQIGDEGSAAWLGREALRELMRIEDGRDPQWENDPLCDGVRAALDGQHPVAFAANAGPEDFAALAPLVVSGESHWAVSLRAKVVLQMQVSLDDIGHPSGEPWALTGGLGDALAGQVASVGSLSGVQQPQGSALDGALAMARALP